MKKMNKNIIQNARVLKETNIKGLKNRYKGKVRDNYFTDGNMIMIATDRISAFDHILSRQIPFKGQVLTSIMKQQADSISDIIPHNYFDMPDPQILVVRNCKPYNIELVVRGYITGGLWRNYKDKGPIKTGNQYGITLPFGMKENQKFAQPIITPTTKSKEDIPVSRKEIISKILLRDLKGIGKKQEPNPFYIPHQEYDYIVEKALKIFKRGQQLALEKNLILVDTKYEFGSINNKIYIIDEVHTPDSSRFWYADRYDFLFKRGKKQKALSKEFVREWLIKQGYDETIGASSLVDLTKEMINETSLRYINLYEKLTGKDFIPGDMSIPLEKRITNNLRIAGYLK